MIFVSFVICISLLRYWYFLLQAGHFLGLVCFVDSWLFFLFFLTYHIPPLLILTSSGLKHFYLLKIFLPWFCISLEVLHTKLNVEFQMRLLDLDNTE